MKKSQSEQMDIIRKPRGKCSAIIINDSVRTAVKNFKLRLQEMSDSPDDECRDIDRHSIKVILNDLDEFDQNILIAFYAIADCSPTILARTLGVEPSVITSRIKKIRADVRNRVNSIIDNN